MLEKIKMSQKLEIDTNWMFLEKRFLFVAY